jgi:hypothetical protein
LLPGIERCVQKKNSDHREYNRARHEAKSSQRRDQPPLFLLKVQPLLELTPASNNADPETN